ncbi:hypothetical protein [Brevundimonas sp.]|uniref:hypothetical protein n=1 Tax=Brevundimonas sp. TaxID=1871086 RepID=UPI0024895972|nr:hypothetical protein [Brevundimonas sp.]MDI1281505.1 hypothetical protein [Brevundimonas sp.]
MEILNPRELASLIWFVGVVGLLVWKAKAWGALLGLVRSFCKPIILTVIALMALWVASSIWVLARIDLWDIGNLKTSLIWFLAFALGWMFNVRRWEGDPSEMAKSMVREVLGVTTAVTFLAEFYTFNIWGELILVPVVSFIVLMATFAQGQEGHEIVAKVFGALVSIIGLSLLSYAAWRLFSDLRGFATPETGREFAVPALLSLLFIPFMYGLAVWNGYGEVSRVLYFTIKDPNVLAFAKRRLFLWFGLDVSLLRRWRVSLFRLETRTNADVRRTVLTMKAARRREIRKPHIPHEFGWSPYRAAKFLSKHDLNAGPYNPSYGEWSALAPSHYLTKSPIGDRLTYQVTGTEEIATKLTLTFFSDRLRKDDEDTPPSSIRALADASTALLMAVFDERFADVSRDLSNGARSTELDGVTVELVEDEGTKLIIRHPMYTGPKESWSDILEDDDASFTHGESS